jgi:hypothetical protein
MARQKGRAETWAFEPGALRATLSTPANLPLEVEVSTDFLSEHLPAMKAAWEGTGPDYTVTLPNGIEITCTRFEGAPLTLMPNEGR